MAKTASTGSRNSVAPREGTYQLIVLTLKDNPAYLLLFAIGLLGGAMGIGTTAVGFFKENTTLMILGFATWALLLLASFLVIIFVERHRRVESTSLEAFDQAAREAFLAGPPAESLSGRWRAKWYKGEDEQRKPYDPDPKEEITVSASRSRVFCSSYDPSTKKTYWLDGRLSDRGIVTLTYWSQLEKGIAGLTGVVFLKVDESFEARGKKLSGWWKGFTRDGQITTGEVEWTKLG